MAFRARSRNRNPTIPEINLTPMLNVMMGILAFFVMITMTLTEEQGVEVDLPGDPAQTPVATPPPVLVVALTDQGALQVNGQGLTMTELAPQLRSFLQRDAAAIVVLEASEAVSYEQVLQTLAALQDIGGDRISLAID